MITDQINIDLMLQLAAAGLSLIPVSAQTKRPIEALLPQSQTTGRGSWEQYQQQPASEQELRFWYEQEAARAAQAAVICGAVSGSLRMLDFDIVRFYPAWRQAVGDLATGLVIQRTGSGGYQAFFRCPDPGKNEKLAWAPDAAEATGRTIAIETRGEGGYAVIAPSLHPSGNRYALVQGDFTQIPMLSQAHADALSDAARRLCEAPYTRQQEQAMRAAMSRQSAHQVSLNGSGSVIDAYNQAVSIEEALTRYGYTLRFSNRWARPGGTNPSVKVENTKSFHHNTNESLSDGHWHDAFDLYCYYEHGNDAKVAARAAATLLCLPPLAPMPIPAIPMPGPAAGPAAQPAAAPSSALTQTLLDAHYTDAGNAECLVALYGDYLCYCHTRKLWLVWDSQRWRPDKDGIAARFALAVAQARYHAAGAISGAWRKELASWAIKSENMDKRGSLLKAAGVHMQFTTTIDQYDEDPFLASTPAGTLDLRTCQVRPAEQRDYLSMQLGAAYDPAAQCPRWLQFLDEVFAGDQELIGYIQRAIGYTLTGDIREQKFFLLWGGGANGKSLLLYVLERLLGDYAGNTSFQSFDPEHRSKIGDDIAALKGKRLVTITETTEDRRIDEARVKSLTGGDLISCRFLYGQQFSYRPTFKFWVAMNHKPIIRGTDRGIWRRVVLVPFTESFEDRMDKQLGVTLAAELPGILNWALVGLQGWHQQGLGSSSTISQATEAYRLESDQVGQWLTESCIVDSQGYLPASDAYALYHLWSKNRGERHPMTQTSWGKSLGERGYASKRRTIGGQSLTCYLGIRLRVDGDSDPAQPASAPAAPAAPQSSYDHDNARQQEAIALVKAGKYDKARAKAGSIRGRKQEASVLAWIDKVERGDCAADEAIV